MDAVKCPKCPVCGNELEDIEIINKLTPNGIPMRVGKCKKCNMSYPINIIR